MVMSLRVIAHINLNVTRSAADVKLEQMFDTGGIMEEMQYVDRSRSGIVTRQLLATTVSVHVSWGGLPA